MPSAIPLDTLRTRAIALGASLAGCVPATALLKSVSHRGHTFERHLQEGLAVVVIALAHDENRLKMDWWDNSRGHTPGNRLLIKVNRRLIKWLRKRYGVDAWDLPYEGPEGGVFLKDAAVLAGIGVMGRNNLVVTPRYGPRVRLRGLLVDCPLGYSSPLEDFAPCTGCTAPCLQACPEAAFTGGGYQRERCQRQMAKNEAAKIVLRSPVVGMPTRYKVAYCRRCELACPVGREF